MADEAWTDTQNRNPGAQPTPPQDQSENIEALLNNPDQSDQGEPAPTPDQNETADTNQQSDETPDLAPVEPTNRGRKGDFTPNDLGLFWNFGVAYQTAPKSHQQLFCDSMGVSGDVVSVSLSLLEPYHRTSSVEGILSLVKTDLDKSGDNSGVTTFEEIAAKFQRGEIPMEEFTRLHQELLAKAEHRGAQMGSDYERRKAELAAYDHQDMRALVRMFNTIGSHYLDDYPGITYRRNMDSDELVNTLEQHIDSLPDAGVEFIRWCLDMLNSWPNAQGRN